LTARVTLKYLFSILNNAKLYSASYLIKRKSQKHDFSKYNLKLRILTLFLGFFRPKIAQKKIRNSIFLINSTRAFDWCMNIPTGSKKYRLFFGKGPPLYGQKLTKNFSQPNMTIHTPIESPCRVDKNFFE
jgi:hypothetical protein